MLAGLLYDASDPTLAAERSKAHALCHRLNLTDPSDAELKAQLLNELFGRRVLAHITPPFYCDYGYNIDLGEGAYFNFNCVLLDVMPIKIGSNTLCGPGVQIYAAAHPVDAAARKSGLELGRPVTIGADVWIGGGTIVCPGVCIGEGSVIGAGSVVTRDIPAGVVAAGNPCRVIRSLER